VRDDRPQCVAIESHDSDHPITSTALRFPVEKVVRNIVRDFTVRLERDQETGETFGFHITSPTGAGETRSVADRSKDADAALTPRKRGRPRLPDDFLRQIALEWENDKKAGETPSYSVSLRHGVYPATVRKWLFKARARGLTQQQEGSNDGQP
jgi:hypothetical protein